MNFDLKNLRELKGLSQAELATALNEKWKSIYPDDENHFNADMIIRMEKKPDKISIDALSVIIQVFGVTFDQLLNPVIPRLTVPSINSKWEAIEETKDELLSLINNFKNNSSESSQYVVEYLERLCESATRKAKIACIGKPDSGKSRMINTLIGKDILPTNWLPTTSTIILLKHINDLPTYAEGFTTFVFKEKSDGVLLLDRLMNEDNIESLCIAKGHYDLINQYGAHSKEENNNEAGAIIAYVDGNILESCDLIDLPGFNPYAIINTQHKDEESKETNYDSKDSMISAKMSQQANGFIYLSIANSFLYGDDLTMAQTIVKDLPIINNQIDGEESKLNPFHNLFFVASHASSVNRGDIETLKRILEDANHRIVSIIEDHPAIVNRYKLFQKDYNYDNLEYDLGKRFYTSEIDSQPLTNVFLNDFTDFIENLPVLQHKNFIDTVLLFCKAQHKKVMLENDNSNKTDSIVFKNNIDTYDNIIDEIYKLKQESKDECEIMFNKIINSKNIVKIVDDNELKKNKNDLQKLVNILNETIEKEFINILVSKSEVFNEKNKDFIATCSSHISISKISDHDTNYIIHNSNASMAASKELSIISSLGALSGLTIIGINATNLSINAVIGAGSLIASSVAIVSTVSSIFAPIVFVATFMGFSVLSNILKLGGTWKKMVGSILVKQYNSEEVLKKLIASSNTFWDDTMKAFRLIYQECISSTEMHCSDKEDAIQTAEFLRTVAKKICKSNIEDLEIP